MDTTAAADNQIEPGSTGAAETTALLTIESLKSGERLLESIELVEKEIEEEIEQREAMGNPKYRSTNPLLLGKSPLDYLIYAIRSIKSADLEQALLVLPFHVVVRLISLLVEVFTSLQCIYASPIMIRDNLDLRDGQGSGADRQDRFVSVSSAPAADHVHSGAIERRGPHFCGPATELVRIQKTDRN
jgi:hypothetical protein